MKSSGLRFSSLVLILAVLLPAACAQQRITADPGPPPAIETTATATTTAPIACSNPRPEVCAQNVQPVCATRDTGIRCITTPCPSSELKTYSNACTACSDPKVSDYHEGACPE